MRKLIAEVRRVEASTSSLSRAQRFNLALYTFALVGLGLIALEVRQTDVSSREVRSLPGPVSTAPARQAGVQPGDRRSVEGATDVPPAAPEAVPSETATGAPLPASGAERATTPSARSETQALGPGAGGGGATAQPAMEGLTAFPPPGSSPFGVADVPFVNPGVAGSLPAMSLVPEPSPVPALPPPPSSRSPGGGSVPAPADPVLAEPPAPRFSGPTFRSVSPVPG